MASSFAGSFVMLQHVIGASSPWLGLLAMFYFLGLVKTARPFCLLRMPRPLRSVRSWEIEKSLYRRMLVHRFGKLLRETPLRYLNTDVYLSRESTDLAVILRMAESAEAAHFWAALLFTPYIGYVWLSGQELVATVFLAIQVLFNIYPILHLRIVRARLNHLVRRRPHISCSFPTSDI